MKSILSIIAAGALVFVSVAQSRAVALQTNWVLNVNFTLTISAQGDTVTNGAVVSAKIDQFRATTKEIIGRLNGTTNHLGAINNFSSAAKLIVKLNVDDNGQGGPTFYVRDIVNRTNIVDTDVSDFIGADGSDSVKSSTENLQNGKKSSTRRMVQRFSFDNRKGLSFEVAGLSTMQESTVVDKAAGNIGEVVKSLSSSVAGTGSDTEDQLMEPFFVVNGSVSVSGGKVEIK